MIRAVAHTFLATAILLPQSAGAQTVASDPAVIEALDVARIWLDAQHDYEELPSIAVAIVHDQELVSCLWDVRPSLHSLCVRHSRANGRRP